MQALLLSVDRASTIIGKVFAWCIVLLTLQVTYEVMVRYAFASPTAWGYDVSYMLYGALFMMAGAYTLARNGHVRGDFLYRQWPVRRQAAFDLVLYFAVLPPGIIALIVSGWSFFIQSFAQNERSASRPTGPIDLAVQVPDPAGGRAAAAPGRSSRWRAAGCAPHRRVAATAFPTWRRWRSPSWKKPRPSAASRRRTSPGPAPDDCRTETRPC